MDVKKRVAEVIERASAAAGSQRAAAEKVGVVETTLTNAKRRGSMQLETYLKLEELAKRTALGIAFAVITSMPYSADASQKQSAESSPNLLNPLERCAAPVCIMLNEVRRKVLILITMAVEFAARILPMPCMREHWQD